MAFVAGKYDVIVVGAGHAGCEAALAAARMGCSTLLLTLNLDQIALMPCNPAIGGPAKGHLVREIDALGGQMGINIDQTAIQVRTLNTAKGPAVQALRAQADKKQYQLTMAETLEKQNGLSLKQAMVEEILIENGAVAGVKVQTGLIYRAKKVILTSGTYLRGRIFIGEVKFAGGPNASISAESLSANLESLGITLDKFETSTPPRIDASTIDYSKMIEQKGDEKPLYFSFMSEHLNRPNISCWLTYTNRATHEIIEKNLHRSPLYTGRAKGSGPRYCPSIEDKILRFADKESHQFFLEPEGINTDEVYVQGMTTGLPEEVQLELLKTIPGLKNVEIIRPGYAIEYDYIIPTQLDLTLQLKKIPGLYCAGQLNGSSGYEEAAAQGIMAGINAALNVKGKEPLILKRSDAYIGVLIDDLVTKGITEPYRVLTSRAEYRLLLRHGNADLRLTEIGKQAGLVSEERYQRFLKKKTAVLTEIGNWEKQQITPAHQGIKRLLEGKSSSLLRQPASLADLLKRPELNYKDLDVFLNIKEELPDEIKNEVEIQIKYEGYIEKQKQQVERFNKLENRRLPQQINYQNIKGLSIEAREKLTERMPTSIGQAARISGVSPADINSLLIFLEQERRKTKSGE